MKADQGKEARLRAEEPSQNGQVREILLRLAEDYLWLAGVAAGGTRAGRLGAG
jgi:hypothetical protein